MAMYLKKHWPLPTMIAGLLLLIGLTLAPYNWNPSALIHTDEVMHAVHPLPSGFVVLEVPAYDGSQYYQIARDMRMIFDPVQWPELASRPPLSYAYQRFLLPFVVFALSLGDETALPWVFLIVNIASLILATVVMNRWKGGNLLATFALVFCPSAMVGLHFSIAEPLALLLLAGFLTRYVTYGRLGWFDIVLLSLLVLSREVNILFVGTVLLYTLYKRHWKDTAMTLIPIGVFAALHGLIYAIFGDFPFLISAGSNNVPGWSALKVVLGVRGYDMYTLSAAALFVGFVLPGFLWSGWSIIKGNRSFAVIGFFLFLCVMLTMPDNIWGSITSIGRVITPVYPLAAIAFAQHKTRLTSLLTLGILLLGLGAGLGLSLIPHPFFIA